MEAEALRPYLPARGHLNLTILVLPLFVLGGEPLSVYGDHVGSVPVGVFFRNRVAYSHLRGSHGSDGYQAEGN